MPEKISGCLDTALDAKNPRTVTARNSLIKTDKRINGYAVCTLYANTRTSGTIITLLKTAGAELTACLRINGLFFRARHTSLVPMAPSRVARLPKIISKITAPEIIFDMRQPIKRPGMAAPLKQGSTRSTSESLNWITPDENPNAEVTIVKII